MSINAPERLKRSERERMVTTRPQIKFAEKRTEYIVADILRGMSLQGAISKAYLQGILDATEIAT